MSRRRKRNFAQRALTVARVGSTVASAAFTGLKIAQGLAALINTEWKHLDNNFVVTPNLGTGSVSFISNIAQGSDVDQRNGDSILPKALQLRAKFSINSSATTTTVRYIILRDMQYDGANPTVPDVLAALDPLAFMNLDNGKRFRILKDWIVTLRKVDKTEVVLKTFLKFNKPRRGTNVHRHWYHIRYDGPASTEADADQGQLLILMISDETVNTPSVNTFVRLRYIDN